ncbi:MAG: N-acetylneuraminate synthase [Epulopiscium sp. Nele67-Bin004]|nr:MAG: N-acetylneuraminate synthase [Epulopiscium sp. Nele67-Bin004]
MSVFIIAEAGVNHNGDFETAKKLVDMAKRCGADAVKFQTFRAQDLVNKFEQKVGYQQKNDATCESQFEMLKRLELSNEQFKQLKAYCDTVGIKFMSTPFGSDALKFVCTLDMPYIKLSSTEVTNHPFLIEVSKCGMPIIMSTGMSYIDEVTDAVKVIRDAGNDNITVLHCTTNYPTPLEQVNMLAIKELTKLGVPVGYSDHTEGYLSAVSAVALGGSVIEKHITLDRAMSGPDHKASMEEDAFANYVKQIRQTELLLGDGIKKPTGIEQDMRDRVRRSVVAKMDLKQGTVITIDMIDYKRPAGGIAPKDVRKILGKTLLCDVLVDEKILESHIDL